jgi:hypothetical protein
MFAINEVENSTFAKKNVKGKYSFGIPKNIDITQQ